MLVIQKKVVFLFSFFFYTTVFADQTIGQNLIVNGSLLVKGKTTLALPTEGTSFIATGPTTMTSLTTSGSALITGALTVTGSTTFSNGIALVNNNSFSITGSLMLGANGAYILSGVKTLASNITTNPTTILTVNFTTTTGCSLVRVIIFGATGAGDLKYDGTFFMGTSNSVLESSTISLTGGGTPAFSISYSVASGSVSLVMSTASGAILSPTVFYEVCGNRLRSIV